MKILNSNNRYRVKLKVIGIGKSGIHILNEFKGYDMGLESYVASVHTKTLDYALVHYKIPLIIEPVNESWHSIYAESTPVLAVESKTEIQTKIVGSDIVFIVAGLGNVTGSSTVADIAQLAKDLGILTISVVSEPFRFEGKRRKNWANQAIERLALQSDMTLVVKSEDYLTDLVKAKEQTLKDAFKYMDGVLAKKVKDVVQIFQSSSSDDIDIEFKDMKRIFVNQGNMQLGTGSGRGDNAVYEALSKAIKSIPYGALLLSGSLSVLVYFKIHPTVSLFELSNAIETIVHDHVHNDANVVFGTYTSQSFEEYHVEVIIIIGESRTPSHITAVNNLNFEN